MTTDPKSWTGAPSWETCNFSTALTNLPRVLATVLKAGPNAIILNGKNYVASVYAQGSKRHHCSFPCSTHIPVPGIAPCFWFGVMIKRMGDANWRKVKNNQYAYHVNTVYVHCFDIRDAYNSGSTGTCRDHWKQYLALRGLCPS